MGHNHQHHHADHSKLNLSFFWGIVLNVVYVVVELWYGFFYSSASLISDAVHNIGDVSSLILAFIAFRLQKLKPGKRFTYGLKKGSILASFINSVILAIAVGAILVEGIKKIYTPQAVPGVAIMIVAGIGIVVNFVSALFFRSGQKGDMNIKAAYLHLLFDALVSLGVVFSGAIIYFTDWFLIDGIMAIVIALVIIYASWSLFKESVVAIMDGVPVNIDIDSIKRHILAHAQVKDVHHIHVWSISTNENALTCHLRIHEKTNPQEIKVMVKNELKKLGIVHATLEIEGALENCSD